MRVAKDLGAEFFMIVPYYPVIDNRKAQKSGKQKTLDQLVSGFALAVEKGKEYGLKVCFETTPQEDIRLSGIEDCRYVLVRVFITYLKKTIPAVSTHFPSFFSAHSFFLAGSWSAAL